ncbi:MAG: hypothetical protein M3362_01785 [Acidobacteriota bacterium]|nr:hypothetical protein [Acidobacteriota bacterium]
MICAATDQVNITKLDHAWYKARKAFDIIVLNNGVNLVIHHCGATNPEYNEFITSYRTLCSERGWRAPGIVLFSGDPLTVEKVDRKYVNDPFICVISQNDLENNLQRFIEANWRDFSAKVDDSQPIIPQWGILRGYSEIEFPLQVLSALLPFGVLWEKSGKTNDNSGLIDSSMALKVADFWGTERLIVERLKELILNGTKGEWDAANSDRGILFVNHLLNEKAKRSRLIYNLNKLYERKQAKRVTTSMNDALQILASSKTLGQWNWRLSALRDHLLI